MIVGVGQKKNFQVKLNIGTHNGIFHCDEVVGVAILELAFYEKEVYVVRTRSLDELKKLDIVIDVGGGKFDHHIAGFDLSRPTGEKYASAGLVWRKYGKEAIQSIMCKEGIFVDEEEVEKIKNEIDEEVIIPVDLEDNGQKVENHIFSFISKFLPGWMQNPDYDADFNQVEKVCVEILKKTIKEKLVKVLTKKELETRFEKMSNGILEIPAQTMPWLEEVVSYNMKGKQKVNFVIFPYPAGGWAAQCVPPSNEEKFSQLIPFPKNWAGKNEESLPEISKVEDAVFCHNGCFFARAKSKEGIIKMCNIATSLLNC